MTQYPIDLKLIEYFIYDCLVLNDDLTLFELTDLMTMRLEVVCTWWIVFSSSPQSRLIAPMALILTD